MSFNLEEEKNNLKLEGALKIQKLEELLLKFSEQVIFYFIRFCFILSLSKIIFEICRSKSLKKKTKRFSFIVIFCFFF